MQNGDMGESHNVRRGHLTKKNFSKGKIQFCRSIGSIMDAHRKQIDYGPNQALMGH